MEGILTIEDDFRECRSGKFNILGSSKPSHLTVWKIESVLGSSNLLYDCMKDRECLCVSYCIFVTSFYEWVQLSRQTRQNANKMKLW